MSIRMLARSRPVLAALLLSATSGLPGASAESKANYFRSDLGVSSSAAALPDNLEAPEALRWRATLDPGHSSPILSAGRIFLTTYREATKELATVALDAEDGHELWRRPVSVAHLEQTHPVGSPATAACDGKLVFVFFGSYGLICYDLDGKERWKQPMGPFMDEYGAGSSTIIVDGKLILNQDHDKASFLMAVDTSTGKTAWRIERPDAVRSYSTPALWTHGGQTELLVAGALELASFAPTSGERLWSIHGLARIVIPTPIPAGDTIYMASWSPGGDAGQRLELDTWSVALGKWDKNHDNKLARAEISDPEVLDRFNRMDLDQDGVLDEHEWERHAAVFRQAQNALLAIKPSGRGELPETAVLWKYQKGVPYVSTPLLDKGWVWMVKDGGIVTKIDATTGQRLQEERLPGMGRYFASPVSGDGKLYFSSEPGVVSVVANQKDWQVVSSRDFHERILATPSIDNGRLYLRTEKSLYCFQRAKN